jgi:hypothetical protein
VARQVGAGQGVQFAQVLRGDPGGEDLLAGFADVDQPVPPGGELGVGEDFAVAQRTPSHQGPDHPGRSQSVTGLCERGHHCPLKIEDPD